jgi:hypothetical protein
MVQTPEILFPWLGCPDFYPSGAARVDTGGSFRGHDPENFVQMQKYLLTRFPNPCDLLLKAQESPGALRRKGRI